MENGSGNTSSEKQMNALTARRRRILSLSTRVTVQCSVSVRGTESNFNVELNTLDGVCPRQDFLLFFLPLDWYCENDFCRVGHVFPLCGSPFIISYPPVLHSAPTLQCHSGDIISIAVNAFSTQTTYSQLFFPKLFLKPSFLVFIMSCLFAGLSIPFWCISCIWIYGHSLFCCPERLVY